MYITRGKRKVHRRRRKRIPPPRRGPRGPRGPRGIQGPQGINGMSVVGPQGERGTQGQPGTLEVNSGINLTDPMFTLESLSNVSATSPQNGELLTYENDQWISTFWKAAKEIYEKCIDSVVNILQVHNGYVGSGSGFFISADGIILTAAHVILATDGRTIAQELIVHVYPDNRSHPMATVLGLDIKYDVALIKIDVGATEHVYLQLEDSRTTKPGEMIVTLGQPAGLHVQSVTMGVVRDNKWADVSDIPESVVSDYDTMGGNSGGPVINAKSKVVGILSWGLNYGDSSSGQNFSLSGAISSHVVLPIINHIISNYENDPLGVPYTFPAKYLGIRFDPVNLYELRVLGKLNLTIEGFIVTQSTTNQIPQGAIITKFNGLTVGQNNNQLPLGTLIHFSTTDSVTLTIRTRDLDNYETEENVVVNLTGVPPNQNVLFNVFQINRKKLKPK